MHEIGIDSVLVKNILDGSKTIEGRLGKPKFLKIRKGDEIIVREDICENDAIIQLIPDQLRITVTQVLYFESFDEMFGAVDFKQAIPFASTKEDAIAAYRRFYTVEDELEYGVISFTFEVL